MAKTAEFVNAYFEGAAQEKLEAALTRACGYPGIHTPFDNSDGYTNGGEIALFPIKYSGQTSGVRFGTKVAVLISHQFYDDKLADKKRTPWFIELIAPPVIVAEVECLIADRRTSTAIPRLQP